MDGLLQPLPFSRSLADERGIVLSLNLTGNGNSRDVGTKRIVVYVELRRDPNPGPAVDYGSRRAQGPAPGPREAAVAEQAGAESVQ